MSTLFIGDFRMKQIKQIQNKSEYIYLCEDTADYAWLSSTVISQLPLLPLTETNVVLMLGFNDCVHSCAWSAFNIDTIAANYVDLINKLTARYPDFNFYICSVNPVDYDYHFIGQSGDSIDVATLNGRIQSFNNVIKNSCQATFIDCYTYLTTLGFETRDGVRFKKDTCNSIFDYIYSKLKVLGAQFTARLETPVVSDDVESDLFWLGTSYGGLNPFENLGQDHAKCEGDTLPNSTAYAWGRFYEILGSEPSLNIANAENWYTDTSDGYKRGKSPALGAIMCWKHEDRNHYAIVEQLGSNERVVTSESMFGDSRYWWTTLREKGEDDNWGQPSEFQFQGFIYCPITMSVSKDDLCTKNSYGISIEEMKPNAQYICQYLSAKGWTLNAIAGLLGNLQQESKMSPEIWESVINGSTKMIDGSQILNKEAIDKYYADNSRYPGYGLVQWTPYYKYTDWCKDNKLPYWDIDSQLQRIEWEVQNSQQWISRASKGYNMSFKDFITSDKNAYWLAGAFAFCYERPARSSGSEEEQEALKAERGENGEYWYNFLQTALPALGEKRLYLADFKVTCCGNTSLSASFLSKNVEQACCEVLTKNKTKVTELNFEINSELTTFEVTGLIPNSEYLLQLTVQNSAGSKISKIISVKTQQSYPTGVGKINLIASNKRVPQNDFKLITENSSIDWGYWKNQGYGFALYLIVNGQVKYEQFVNFLPETILLSSFFGYSAQLGDTVQIGIRTWVIYENNVLFDNNYINASEPHCMLVKPVSTFINN